VAQRTRPGGVGNGTLVYLHGDHLGSVTLTTGDGGAKVSSQEYDAWGKVRAGDNSGTTPIDFTGQHRDGTGLLYYGARYYDSALGRFLSGDTVGGSMSDPQSWNPYSYVRNNPLNRTDPTGHDPLGNGSYNPGDPNNQIIYPATAPGGYGGYGGYGTPPGGLGGYGGYGGSTGCGNLGPNVSAYCAPTPEPTTAPTATGTAAPLCFGCGESPTPTVSGPCGNMAAYCVSPTATAGQPTLTPTPQTILTAQGTAGATGTPVPYGTYIGGMPYSPGQGIMPPLQGPGSEAILGGAAAPRTVTGAYGNYDAYISGYVGSGGIVTRQGNGVVDGYAVYGSNGYVYYRVDITGPSHGGVPTPHLQFASVNYGPNGAVYPDLNPSIPALYVGQGYFNGKQVLPGPNMYSGYLP